MQRVFPRSSQSSSTATGLLLLRWVNAKVNTRQQKTRRAGDAAVHVSILRVSLSCKFCFPGPQKPRITVHHGQHDDYIWRDGLRLVPTRRGEPPDAETSRGQPCTAAPQAATCARRSATQRRRREERKRKCKEEGVNGREGTRRVWEPKLKTEEKMSGLQAVTREKGRNSHYCNQPERKI